MTESQARDEICRVGRSLFERGYVHATAGNISVRLDASDGGGFLITRPGWPGWTRRGGKSAVAALVKQ